MEAVTRESLEKAYKRYSKFYDLVFGAVFHPGRKTAVEKLECRAGDKVLEVGVGTGLSLPMYSHDVRVTGIDLSAEMLAKAQKRVQEENLTHVEDLLQMDAQEMTFEDSTFDKVIAMYVASVVPDVSRLASEIRRVCKPGGTIIFLNHFENKNPVVKKAESFIQPLAKYLGFHPDFPLEEFLEKTKFEVTEKIPVNMLDYWTVLVGENKKS